MELIALFQIVSVLYFFMVYRVVKRGSLPAPVSPPTSVAQTGTHEIAVSRAG